MILTEIPQIFSFFTDEIVSSDVLQPDEKPLTAGFMKERLQTFAAGRFCARHAMQLMGLPDAPILVGKDRAPVWPKGVAGSISHTQGLAGAMVSSLSHYPSIGLDIERRGVVHRNLWHLLFDELEQQQILRAEIPDDQATLYFSLKEAYYKMQYPLTGMFLDFKDVRVEDGPNGMRIDRLKSLPVAAPAHQAGYLFSGEFVVSWVLAEG